MKFHNGCWLLKEGYGSFSPQQVYEIRKSEYEVQLCAPTRKILKKGDTLYGINLTIRVTAPMPEMIRVKVIHHKGVQRKEPEFALNLPGLSPLKEEGNLLKVISGHLALVVDKEDWSMRYERGGKLLSKRGEGDLAYIKTNWTGSPYDVGKENEAYMRQQMGVSVRELIYGLGERFTPFVKNGQSVSIWNGHGAGDKGCVQRAGRKPGLFLYKRPVYEGGAEAVHGSDRKAGQTGSMDLRSVAVHLIYHGL